MMHNTIITENQLDEWVRGNAREAQGVIVELVWRLVAASSPKPRDRRFPLGDSIGQPGADGFLHTDFEFDPFVPEGKSFWEIGTGIHAGSKATSDYNDRTTATPCPYTNPEDLSQIEWAFLPLLNPHHEASPKLLEQRLADDPAFFCEVIRIVFRSKKEERSALEPTEQQKNVATNAYRLLSEWRTPPGSQKGGAFNGDALTAWLENVKAVCEESGHLEVALSMVGHVLIHTPPDPDGLWLHHSAAMALNTKDTDDMRDGFRTALFNSRGVHWVDPEGHEERQLAEKYRVQAEEVEARGYHRLASTLRELATSYERDADRQASRDLFDE
jgi:hypothetical protein